MLMVVPIRTILLMIFNHKVTAAVHDGQPVRTFGTFIRYRCRTKYALRAITLISYLQKKLQ